MADETTLSGTQVETLREAILAGYPRKDDLRNMVRIGLEENLQVITTADNLSAQVMDLIGWAESTGRTADLIAAAYNYNRGNLKLAQLVQDAVGWSVFRAAGLAIVGDMAVVTGKSSAREAVPAARPEAGTCPYLGLDDYKEEDADRFFGREALTEELTLYLRHNHFLAVVGASGSGKSSLVHAGIIPAVKRGALVSGSDRWLCRTMVPGEQPLKQLAVTLAMPGDAEAGTHCVCRPHDGKRAGRTLPAPRRSL